MDIDGELMKKSRERQFLTQAELAEKAGVTESTINRLENGLQRARISTVRKIALALGVAPTLLSPGEEEGKAAA